MDDAVVKIAAIVSTDQLQEGMATSATAVQDGVGKIGVSFQEMSTKAQAAAAAANRAFTSISADVKAATAGLSDQALKEALLAKVRVAANADVRTSLKLLNNDQFDSVKATELYAASTQRLVAIDAEIATAHKEAAKASAMAAEEAKLSSNVWVASMQRIALAAKESFAEVQEMMAGTVERANLTASGMKLGFSGLSEFMGAALVVGGIAEALDETTKMVNELEHLHIQTGINITSLSGLKQIAKGMQADFEPISRGLVRLARAQIVATEAAKSGVEGTDTASRAFRDLGISLHDIEHLSPEQMLYRVSAAMADNTRTAVAANSAIALFGKGGAAVISVLKEQGADLEKNMKEQGELTGVTEKSAEAARRWAEDIAKLEAEFRRGLLPVLQYMPDILRGIEGDFLIAKAEGQTAFEGIATAVVAAGWGLVGFARVLEDVTTGNFAAVKADALKAKNEVVDTWKKGAADITKSWKDVHETFAGPAPTFAKANDVLGGSDLSDLEGSGKGKGKKDHAVEERLKAMELEYAELQQAHKLTLKEEHDFWAARIGEFARGTDQYRQLAEKMGALDQEGAKKSGSAIAQFKSGDAVGALDSLTGEKKPKDDGKTAVNESILKEQNEWIKQQGEDLMRTGARWREYHQELARGIQIEAANAANLQLDAIQAALAEGTISKLGAAKRIAAIHTAEYTAKLKELEAELLRIAKDESLTPAQKATQSQGVQNQMTQMQGQGQQSAAKDTQAINTALVQPYLKAFDKINQGWLKVQKDLIAGNKNIQRDFVQMGVNIVQSMAASFEQMLAKHALMSLKMEIQHMASAQAGVAIDASAAVQSTAIKQTEGLKQMLMDAKSAAVSGWKAGMALPFPENVVMAPVLAGVGLAGAMAYFEQGGVVTGGNGFHVPVLAKAGERVLSTTQTNNFERMVNSPGSASSGSRTMNANITQNFGGSKSASARELVAGMQMAHRRGKLV